MRRTMEPPLHSVTPLRPSRHATWSSCPRLGALLALLLACLLSAGIAATGKAEADPRPNGDVGAAVTTELVSPLSVRVATAGPAGFVPLPLTGTRADTSDVVPAVCPETFTLQVAGSTLRVPYCANRTLGPTYPDVTRAIVVLHGTLRNAGEYQDAVVLAGQMAGGADATTFIITPQFLVEADIQHHQLDDEYPFWAYMGWRKGDQSIGTLDHPRPARISSFGVIDTVLARIAATCPNLQQVVMAGHSAGGQFSNLWTAGTAMHGYLMSNYGVPVRSIVSNPSSYIYFSPERWIRGTTYQFAVPDAQTIADCPGYDDYKYGLQALNPYMSSGADTLRARYSSREVAYLLGGNDTNPYDFYLDKDCPAMLMGDFRLQRGLVYTAFLTHYFGDSIWQNQALAVIPGVAHDHVGIFTSACGLYYLYDYGSCDSGPPAGNWDDVTTYLLNAVTCHGAGWGDYDGDGRPDLYLPATDASDALAHNLPDSFTDGTLPPLNDAGHGMCAKWGDYDNDRKLDLFVVNWQSPCRLFHNDGAGAFSDVTPPALALNGDCVDAAWADYDSDGDLDLYVLRTTNQGCRLFRNDGGGAFSDVTAPPLNVSGTSRCAAWGDYDNDGDPDLFVARDQADKLFRNDGNGSFTDVTSGALADNGNGSSAAWGDYDNDGRLDLYIVNRNGASHLLRNDGNGFTSVQTSGVNVQGTGHAGSWVDYDNDGWLDLYLCNDGQANRLFRNLGDGGFEEITGTPLSHQGANYGASWADYDGDGKLDVYLTVNNGENHLFRNGVATGRHWLHFQLTGTESNASAIGTRVRVLAGGIWQLRQIGGDAGYMSQNLGEAAFGLGSAVQADSVVIEWPRGIVQRFGPMPADARMEIIESDAPQGVPGVGPFAARLRVVPNPMRDIATFYPSIGSGVASLTTGFTLSICDAGGRVVRRLSRPGSGAASTGLAWDGRDEEGRRVAAGIYFVRAHAGSGGTTRVIVVR